MFYNNNFLKSFLLLSFLLGTKIFASEVVIVSDIDDTIKRSHILGLTHGVTSAGLKAEEFSGMAELYTQMNLELTKNNSVKLYYVSNAPKILMSRPHEMMLNFNQFPKGELILAGILEKQHKENSISKIIEEENPKTVIFLGDNGEDDVYVYNNMREKYKNRPITFLTYIRIAYHIEPNAKRGEKVGKPMFPNQMGFATATEIAYDLFSKKILQEDDVVKVADSTLHPKLILPEQLHIDNKTHLPYWYDCRDHQVLAIPEALSCYEVLENHNEWLSERCSLSPLSKIDLIKKEI